jgi:hypothetical protein
VDFEFAINGKPVKVEDWRMEQRVDGSSASLRMSVGPAGSPAIPGDNLVVRGDGRTWFEGTVRSKTRTGSSVEVEAVDYSLMTSWTGRAIGSLFRFGDMIRAKNAGPHAELFMVLAHDQHKIDVVRAAEPFDVYRRQHFSSEYWEIAG